MPVDHPTAPQPGALVLADGSVFEGEIVGARLGVASGEVVFNTVLTGYQEVITDPSYAGQIVAFTYPHIGNYGVAAHDNEARRPYCRGVVMVELARRRSNWRSDGDLDGYLAAAGVSAIAGVDTRRLTRHIRSHGSMPGAFGTAAESELARAAEAEPGTVGVDLVSEVTTTAPYVVTGGPWRVVAYDLGLKRSIVTQLSQIAEVTVVGASTSADEALSHDPHGVFLSNGPGDPELAGPIIDELRMLLDAVPVFGICLGHQVLALTLGGSSYKMPFGHHGGNVPVRNQATGGIEITSQNHNYAIAAGTVDDVTETHVCVNDETLEGLEHNDLAAFSVQYHPEAAPGPHDSRYLFERFADLMAARWGRVG